MGAAVCLGLQIIFGHTLIQKAFDVILKGRKVTNFAQVHIAHLDVLLIVHPFLFLKQTKKSCFQAVIFSWKENGCHSCWCQIFCTHWQESPQFLFQSTNRCFSKFLLVDIKGVKSCPKRCGKGIRATWSLDNNLNWNCPKLGSRKSKNMKNG